MFANFTTLFFATLIRLLGYIAEGCRRAVSRATRDMTETQFRDVCTGTLGKWTGLEQAYKEEQEFKARVQAALVMAMTESGQVAANAQQRMVN